MAYVAKTAVILAAGRGLRLGKFTMNNPKPLLRYDGTPIIETIIERLLNLEIGRIVVVTGYMAERFGYLAEKYGVTLVHNPRWNEGNNCLSVRAALHHCKNALIVNGDAIVDEYALDVSYDGSCMYADNYLGRSKEWALKVGAGGYITEIDVNGGTGIIRHREASFVAAPQYAKFCEQIELAAASPKRRHEYFEFSLLAAGKVKAKLVPVGSIYDIDTEREWANDPRADQSVAPQA